MNDIKTIYKGTDINKGGFTVGLSENERFGLLKIIIFDSDPMTFYIIAKDPAESLGYNRSREAFRKIVDSEFKSYISLPQYILNINEYNSNNDLSFTAAKSRCENENSGRYSKVAILSEPGFYQMILKSNKPNAQEFQQWVFVEVIPAIRKYGYYRDKDNTYASSLWGIREEGKQFRKSMVKVYLHNPNVKRRIDILSNYINIALFSHMAYDLKVTIGLPGKNRPDVLIRDYFDQDALTLLKEVENTIIYMLENTMCSDKMIFNYLLSIEYLSMFNQLTPYTIKAGRRMKKTMLFLPYREEILQQRKIDINYWNTSNLALRDVVPKIRFIDDGMMDLDSEEAKMLA